MTLWPQVQREHPADFFAQLLGTGQCFEWLYCFDFIGKITFIGYKLFSTWKQRGNPPNPHPLLLLSSLLSILLQILHSNLSKLSKFQSSIIVLKFYSNSDKFPIYTTQSIWCKTVASLVASEKNDTNEFALWLHKFSENHDAPAKVINCAFWREPYIRFVLNFATSCALKFSTALYTHRDCAVFKILFHRQRRRVGHCEAVKTV